MAATTEKAEAPLPSASTPTNAPPSAPKAMTKSHGELLFLQTVAGAGSGAITKTATAPLERIKIIFQIQVGFKL